MIARVRYLLLMPVLLLTGACSQSAQEPDYPPASMRALTADEAAVSRADNRFGLELFRTLAGEPSGENVFLSPLSVSTALSLTANGAAGQTRSDMLSTLARAGMDAETMNRATHDLAELLSGADPRVTVEIANSVWPRRGVTLVPTFADVADRWYDAEVEALDFSAPASVDRINGWANERTHGMIPRVLDGLDPSAVLYLMNAVYFKGTWKARFDTDDTRDAPFHNADGTTTTVPMMTLETRLPVLRTDRFDAFDLAYGDSLFSMTVVLPDPGVDPEDLLEELDAETWASWVDDLQPADVQIWLPRFRTSYKTSLVEPLSALGMGIAFEGGRADFSNLVAGGGLWIGDVLHQAVVEVNEEGTEAAAVTTVVVVTSIGGGGIRVDRPFLFAIRERSSGALLFLGLIRSLA